MTKRPLFVSWGPTLDAPCPHCRVILRSATGLSETGPVRPAAGELTLCDQCETWLAWTDTGAFRYATAAEVDALDPALKRLAYDAARVASTYRTPRH